MASLVLTGDTSGQVTLAAPAVAGTNTATLPVATGELSMLGASSQSWTDVTSSRVIGTTYTNTTGKPIAVSASGSAVGAVIIILTVNGVALNGSLSQAATQTGSMWIVPPSATYVLSGVTSLVQWRELR